ncbi:hypothetical protein [uncultured Sphaerotilus sp.]|uniref:hypothetical protein n=1 Tax=uncultured Sphaerotilus sp. TaxID=474984 RepID=UPI0030CA5680
MSTATGPPAALARSLGSKLETSGNAVASAATPPATPVAMSHWRFSGSLGVALKAGQAMGRVVFMVGSLPGGHAGFQYKFHATACTWRKPLAGRMKPAIAVNSVCQTHPSGRVRQCGACQASPSAFSRR